MNHALREGFVLVQHEHQPYLEEIDAFKHEGALVHVGLDVLFELAGHLGPVHGRAHVMTDVIAVVKAAAIVACVDARDAVAVAVAGCLTVDKRVLTPVAAHHEESHGHERNDEDRQSRLPVYEAKRRDNGVVAKLANQHAAHPTESIALVKVHAELDDSEEEEAAEVDQKVAEVVAAVGKSAAQIVFEIVLRVMHTDVVCCVGFGRLTEEGTKHPRDVVREEAVLLFE